MSIESKMAELLGSKVPGLVNTLTEGAEEAQKKAENDALKANDASHGEKPTKVLDEDADAEAQKKAENDALKSNDASHGEKPTKVKTLAEFIAESEGQTVEGDDEDDDELNESTRVKLRYERNFTSDVVGRFFSACSHDEGTNMPIPENITLVSNSRNNFTFQFPVYDSNEGEWFIAEGYFKFDYSSTPIEDGFATQADAVKALKGKRI